MSPVTLVSIQVGLPRVMDGEGSGGQRGPWQSGILKTPVLGPVRVGQLGCEGDGQADLVHHGGPDKTVLAYSAEHYPLWRAEVEGLADLDFGGFGENLTLAGVTEQDVCIGDVWQIGQVRLEVSQPRQPCWKLGCRWRLPDLPRRVVQTGRSGWYLRVAEAGTLEPGMALSLLARPHPQWTVSQVASLYYDRNPEPAAVADLAALAELAESWRIEFARRLA
jgi:MOSC domain-containing protein YiiM